MRMDKMTSKFQQALADAQSLATGLDHQLIEPAHVMVALLDQEGGASRHLLTKAGVRVNPLRSQLGERLDSLPRVSGAAGEISLSNDLIKLLNLTDKLAQKRGDQYVSSELFILAAMDLKGALADAESEARALVRRFKGMYDRTHQSGAIGNIREVMRDIRWHSRRYARWITSGPDGEQQLDPELLWEIAERAGLADADPDGRGHDEESLRIATYLYRYAYRALGQWLSWLEVENLRDFDSLILDARRLLTRPGTRPALEAVRSRYRILIIDEFQDTDQLQYQIVRAVWHEARLPLFLIGDPKQAIYAFRGADVFSYIEATRDVGENRRTLSTRALRSYWT